MELTGTESEFKSHANVDHKVDRIGIMASILCAIHCALTPVLLIAIPAFGKAWSHPATHWGMAIIVIPIAIWMMLKGYRKHSKKWIIITGSIGIALIVVGAILPYIESSPKTPITPANQVQATTPVASTPVAASECDSG